MTCGYGEDPGYAEFEARQAADDEPRYNESMSAEAEAQAEAEAHEAEALERERELAETWAHEHPIDEHGQPLDEEAKD